MTHVLDRCIFAAVHIWVVLRYPTMWRFQRRHSKGPYNPVLPRSLNEKFWWRKLFDHDPRYTILADKLAAKDWALNRCSELQVARTLWQGKDPRAIPAEVLAGDVVVKLNNACHRNIFIWGGDYDRATLEQKLLRWMEAPPYGRDIGEWAYGSIERQILVEEMLGTKAEAVHECKLMCFGGPPHMAMMVWDRATEPVICGYLFSADGRDVTGNYGPDLDGAAYKTLPPPPHLQRMVSLATRLAEGFDHMRVDFLSDGQNIWFGEMTMYNLAGIVTHCGDEIDHPSALAWDIGQSHFLRNPPRWGWRAVYARALKRYMVQVA